MGYILIIAVIIIAVLILAILSRKKRNSCPNCSFDLRKFSTTISSTHGLLIRNGFLYLDICPMCRAKLPHQFRIPFIDLRPEEEKRIEREAEVSLGGEDEEIAQKLYMLLQEKDMRGIKEVAKSEIRKIGEYLGSNGGDKRMRQIAYRVAALGGSDRYLEHFWNGICGWKA